MTLSLILTAVAVAVALVLPYLPRRVAMTPCRSCGITRAGAVRTADRCATCREREHVGARTAELLRAIRAQADAAVWR